LAAACPNGGFSTTHLQSQYPVSEATVAQVHRVTQTLMAMSAMPNCDTLCIDASKVEVDAATASLGLTSRV
jgi:hypothetical protein